MGLAIPQQPICPTQASHYVGSELPSPPHLHAGQRAAASYSPPSSPSPPSSSSRPCVSRRTPRGTTRQDQFPGGQFCHSVGLRSRSVADARRRVARSVAAPRARSAPCSAPCSSPRARSAPCSAPPRPSGQPGPTHEARRALDLAGWAASQKFLTKIPQPAGPRAPRAAPAPPPRFQCSHESAREPSLVPRSSAVGGGRGAAAERVHSCRGAPIPRDDSGQRCGAPRLGRFAATLFPLRTSAEPAPRPRSVPFGAELPRGGAVGHLILIAAVSGNNSSQLRLHYVHTDGGVARKHRDAAAREQAAGG